MTSASHHDSVRRIFDEWAADGRGAGMEKGHRDVVLQMLDGAQIQRHHHVLDLGCGQGWTVRLLAELVPDGRAYGIDASETMIEQARGAANPAHVAFTAAPVDALPFADASLQRVITMESIYYWEDIAAGLAEAFRVLAPGGMFLAAMEFYADNPWSAAWAGALGLELRRHSAAEYEEMLGAAGFELLNSVRLRDRRPAKSEADFEASPYFPDYRTYRKYLEEGALLVTGRKPGQEAGPQAGPQGGSPGLSGFSV